MATEETLPSREAIENRLHAQRDRLLNAQGICTLAISAAENGDADIELTHEAMKSAFYLLTDLLENIGTQLLDDHVLAPAVTGEEAQS